MDNPFIGLDSETRDQLKQLLKTLAEERELQIIIVLSKNDDLPDFITHVVEVDNMTVYPKVTKSQYIDSRKGKQLKRPPDNKADIIMSLPQQETIKSNEIVRFTNIKIAYGNRTIQIGRASCRERV